MPVITKLDRSNIDAYVAQPGIALLNWGGPRAPQSSMFDAAFRDLSEHYPEVHFAAVDTSTDSELAASWAVAHTPELMAYRDGTLVFDYPGVLPVPAVETLIEAIGSLNMDEVRRGVDGHGPRLHIVMQPTGSVAFALGGNNDQGPTRPTG